MHTQCRLEYTNAKAIRTYLAKKQCVHTDGPGPSRRSIQPVYDPRINCLFCGTPADVNNRKKGQETFPVQTKPHEGFQATILRICDERNDDWAKTVSDRIRSTCREDLFAWDAVYHHACSVSFRTYRNIPARFAAAKKAKPAPSSEDPQQARHDAFIKVCQYLEENDDEQTTLSDLVSKMQEFCGDGVAAYTTRHMKTKLLEHFDTDVLISSRGKKTNVVTLRTAAWKILSQYFESPQTDDPEAKKLNLITTAAKLIKSDIRGVFGTKDVYPGSEDIKSAQGNLNFVPESLQLFLKTIFCGKENDMKIAAIGQAIMQAARPRTLLSPLQVGLAVQMHHQFASQFLIDVLFQLGFCVSYPEVKKFEMSAAMAQGTDIPGVTHEHFVHYVADNVDHNVCTLDGFNTFHGMGTIAVITPGTRRQQQIPRISITSEDVAAVGKTDIHFCNQIRQDFESLKYTQLHDFQCKDPQSTEDTLWKVSWPLRSPRPAWSGFMQLVSRGEHPGQSSVYFLPMIDLNPSDMSCVYSTLRFVCAEARRHGVSPVLTFDQPLWWKSQLIVQKDPQGSDLKSVVLRLGGFHIEMSFLGCIGKIMSGSGLQQVLEVVYAPNTVGHMLAGRAMARAFRGHKLVDSALNAIITARAFNVSLPEPQAVIIDEALSGGDDSPQADSQQCETDEAQRALREFGQIPGDLQQALQQFDALLQGKELSLPREVLDRIERQLEEEKRKMDGHRTAQLWLQYMDMVDILRRFARAERTGNWHLHLRTLREMLPFLAAAGHNLYTKSIYIYLLQMQDLPFSHPEVFESFSNGHHVVRRSERYWAGLSL